MNTNTASNIIPFSFGAQEVRALLISDQPWFVASDVCASLSIGNASLAVNGRADRESDGLDGDEKGIAIVNTPYGDQQMLVVSESGLYSLIFKSRKKEAKRFQKWVTGEVLPAIRKHGRYEDAVGRMNDLCGALGLQRFRDLKRSKVSHLPAETQRKAMARIGQDLNIAFGVRSAADIPAAKVEAACTFIGAYALEGEWLAKETTPAKQLDFHCTIEEWKARNPNLFRQDNPNSEDLMVSITDLVMSTGSPCLELFDKLHNAGYCIDGAYYEFRSYQNLMNRMDQLVRSVAGSIGSALGSLERGRMKPQEYVAVKSVA